MSRSGASERKKRHYYSFQTAKVVREIPGSLNYMEEGQLLAKAKDAMNLIGRTGVRPRRGFLLIDEDQRSEL